MAEDTDQESKTEEPTEKRIADAIEKGNVAASRDIVTAGTLAGILLSGKLMLGAVIARITEILQTIYAKAGELQLATQEDATFLIAVVAKNILVGLSLLILPIAAGGVLASVMQNMPQANGERIRPKLSRLSMLSGWGRLFGAQGLGEFLRALMKLTAVSAIAIASVRSEIGGIINSLSADPGALPNFILGAAVRLVACIFLLSLVLAAIDGALSRRRWRIGLRMTRQEVKDEFRQQEGDPMLKQRIRSIGRQRASRRMLKKMPTATLVVVNPTHYAVALRYVRNEGGAPVVIAKGIDYMALRIREIANVHEIPIVENRPLARALHDHAEVDQMIPAEFYRAVAEIIHFLQLRKMYGARSGAA